jgi:hypothetical protein
LGFLGFLDRFIDQNPKFLQLIKLRVDSGDKLALIFFRPGLNLFFAKNVASLVE